MQLTIKPLSRAISFALAGSALFIGGVSNASASTTMYNTFTTSAQTSTDGWVYGFKSNAAGGTNSTRAIAYNSANPQAYTAAGPSGGGFYGTDGTNYSSILPFGYGGTSHLNWGLHLTSAGDSAEISQQDAINHYGYAAEIDTGGA